MKNPANEYEFQKLNADFDRKLDRLSDAYKRKADEILHADRYGLDMRKQRNRLWMWFDRKTGYKLLPKVVSAMFLATIVLLGLVFFLVYHNVEAILSVDMGAVIVALSLAMLGEIIILISIFSETSSLHSGDALSNAMLNPGLHHLKGNIWHRDTDQ
jgi:hypothetical protein